MALALILLEVSILDLSHLRKRCVRYVVLLVLALHLILQVLQPLHGKLGRSVLVQCLLLLIHLLLNLPHASSDLRVVELIKDSHLL